jgi:hypothetical protein
MEGCRLREGCAPELALLIPSLSMAHTRLSSA